MWSDNDIDTAFQRLNPPEPEPTPFPLDAWLRLETQLDKAVIARAVRRKLWRFFAAEVVAAALVALGWLLWPAGPTATAGSGAGRPVASGAGAATAVIGKATERNQNTAAPTAQPSVAVASDALARTPRTSASAEGNSGLATVPEKVTRPAVAAAASSAAVNAPLLAAASSDASRKQAKSLRHEANTEHELVGTALSAGFVNASAARETARLTQERTVQQSRTATDVASTTGNEAATRPSLPPTVKPVTAVARQNVSGSASRHSRQMRNARPAPTAENQAARDAAVANAADASTDNTTNKNLGLTAANPAAPAELAALALRPVLLPVESPAQPFSVTAVPVAAPAPIVPVRQPRFYVGLVGAPDVTTVKFVSVQGPMPNVGVTLEYRLTNRLRLTTGLLRSTKEYTARREDYDFGAYASRVYQRNFEDVDGACTVLDVPLNVRYDWAVGPRHKFFGSAGLSSFFMQREAYSYVWVENNMLNKWEGHAVNQNRSLGGILNLSAGCERSLGRHWSVQAEPYVKLPLAGIGLGKVKLTSAGVFLGVKYGF